VSLLRQAIDLAVQPLPTQRRAAIDELLEDLRRATWETPDGFLPGELHFHALGVPGAPGRRALGLRRYPAPGDVALRRSRRPRPLRPGNDRTIIGRQEELDRLPEATLDGCTMLVFNELAALDLEDEVGPARLTGLHAKTYVVEYGRRARVIVGSANATGAAFTGNVELLMELVGSRERLGIDPLAGEGADLRAILEEYERRDVAEPDDDTGRELEDYLRDVATVPFHAAVRTDDEGGAVGGRRGEHQEAGDLRGRRQSADPDRCVTSTRISTVIVFYPTPVDATNRPPISFGCASRLSGD
jgi:hypothetical protein